MRPDPFARETENEARRSVLELCLHLDRTGLNRGASGNVSLRWDRGGLEGLLITPSAVPPARLEIEDIAWIPRGPGVLPDPPPWDGPLKPSSEWRMHHDLYQARPELQCVVHAHATHATALSCLAAGQRQGIPSFHYMVALAGGRDIRCAAYATYGSAALSENALRALEGRRACLLANHGLLAAGRTPEAALDLALEVESLAQQWLLCLASGQEVAFLDDAEMDRVIGKFAGYRPQA